jgi:hypothetical protein
MLLFGDDGANTGRQSIPDLNNQSLTQTASNRGTIFTIKSNKQIMRRGQIERGGREGRGGEWRGGSQCVAGERGTASGQGAARASARGGGRRSPAQQPGGVDCAVVRRRGREWEKNS